MLIATLLITLFAADPTFAPLQFLTGDWIGEGSGGPGQGSGGFSFKLDLQDKVMVRKNVANYPATADRPASTHDDLMIIYKEPGAPMRADYYDSEGHVIRYAVTVDAGGKTVQFLSDVAPNAPRYRLSYTSTGKDTVSIKFEIAPPGKPEEFKAYIGATAHRK